MQPYLSAVKTKTALETKSYEMYKNYLATDFLTRRQQLTTLLAQLPFLLLVDTQALFDTCHEELFIDPCHLNEKGVELVLQIMSPLLNLESLGFSS